MAAFTELYQNIIHTLDHMHRLHERCEEDEDRAVTARQTKGLKESSTLLASAISEVIECFGRKNWRGGRKVAAYAADEIKSVVKPYRESVMASVAAGEIDMTVSTRRLEAVRWLRRVSRHVSRIAEHLTEVFTEEAPQKGGSGRG